MSLLEHDNFHSGTFSLAGRDSAEKYNVVAEANKVAEKAYKKPVKQFFQPDPDWETNVRNDQLGEINILRECNFDIDNIKNVIKLKAKSYGKKIQNQEEKENKTEKDKNKNKNKIEIKSKNKEKSGEKKEEDKENPKKETENNKKNFESNKENRNKFVKNQQNESSFFSIFSNNKYKYHNIHMERIEKYKREGLYQKMNMNQEPIYNPNKNIIFKKLNTGPKWAKLTGRGKFLFKEENKPNNSSFSDYSGMESIQNSKKKGFIDMSKQTERNGFPMSHNLRERYEKKFIQLNDQENLMNETKNCLSPKTSKNFMVCTLCPRLIKHFHLFPYSMDMLPLSENKRIMREEQNKKNRTNKIIIKKCQSVPDFKRYLSRDQLNQAFKKKDRISNEVLYPNYKSIEGGVKMMVIYNKERNKNNISEYHKKFRGICSSDSYNASDTFEIIYGNKLKAVPLFQKMSSRPINNNLPSFMSGLFNRMCFEISTDKTLKMNNYSNGKLYNLCNDFLRKNNKKENNYIYSVKSYFDWNMNGTNINTKEIRQKKIQKDLDITSKKFNILYNQYLDYPSMKI